MKKRVSLEILKLETIRQNILKEEKRKNRLTEHEKLRCKKQKNSFQYYIGGKFVGKRAKMEHIRALAVAEYHDKLLRALNIEIRALQRAMQTDQKLSDVYRCMHKGKQVLFQPEYSPVEMIIQKFEKEEYVGLGFSENDPAGYITNRGERVRSKSEKIIADELDRQGIPYKYEKPLKLNVDGMVKDFYPDFTALNISTGEVKYLEHLGMMDNPHYYKNTLAKLDAYEKNGLLIGRDIILLHESFSRPLNTRSVVNYIKEFLT